jgi:hypothetical protein
MQGEELVVLCGQVAWFVGGVQGEFPVWVNRDGKQESGPFQVHSICFRDKNIVDLKTVIFLFNVSIGPDQILYFLSFPWIRLNACDLPV